MLDFVFVTPTECSVHLVEKCRRKLVSLRSVASPQIDTTCGHSLVVRACKCRYEWDEYQYKSSFDEGTFPFEKGDTVRTHDLASPGARQYNNRSALVLHTGPDKNGKHTVAMEMMSGDGGGSSVEKFKVGGEHLTLQCHAEDQGSVRLRYMMAEVENNLCTGTPNCDVHLLLLLSIDTAVLHTPATLTYAHAQQLD